LGVDDELEWAQLLLAQSHAVQHAAPQRDQLRGQPEGLLGVLAAARLGHRSPRARPRDLSLDAIHGQGMGRAQDPGAHGEGSARCGPAVADPPARHDPENARAWVALAFLAGALCALLFGTAGTLRYGQAWIYIAIFLGAAVLTTLYLMKRDPALLARRMRGGP